MKAFVAFLILSCWGGVATANAVYVTVGNTGCPGRQIGVTESWNKIPRIISVTVVPRQPKDPAAQRVFMLVSETEAPTEEALREALGRRAKHYPILKIRPRPADL